jgi:hypothetical protein
MSAICAGCKQKIKKPDTFWYAGTRYSPTINFLCGTCLAFVPKSERVPATFMQDFRISFGQRFAEVNDQGFYQSNGSEPGPIEFWVEPDVLRSRIPCGEFFLYQLYPYYCMEQYVCTITKKLYEQGIDSSQFRQHIVTALQNVGSTVESTINIRIYGPGMKEDTSLASSKSIVIPIQIPEELAHEMLDKLEAQKLVQGKAA